MSALKSPLHDGFELRQWLINSIEKSMLFLNFWKNPLIKFIKMTDKQKETIV